MGENALISGARTNRQSTGKSNERYTITLSPAAVAAFDELKDWTDASTDSEVFRNALRLHKMLLRAHREGKRFLMKDTSGEITAIELFGDL